MAPRRYKLKHRPPPITRLLRYERLPPPLTDDPPRDWDCWAERCAAVYAWMIALKRGARPPVPEHRRRGLWFHAA